MSDLVIGDDGLARPSWAASNPLLLEYYDTEWGVPVNDERGLFERISLEAFQSGLSWLTILRKREAFRLSFANFDPDQVATFNETQIADLLENSGIIRNRAKILATINNAQATIRMRETGGLVDFVWSFQPKKQYTPKTLAEIPTQSAESEALSNALRKSGFKFVGPTTIFALMEAIGMVNTHLIGSHRRPVSP